MSNRYAKDRAFSDQYLPAIKSAVGSYLLEPSPFEIDTREAADLVVLRAKTLCIACRVRRPGYLPRYDNQFTLRCRLDSGVATEEEKIINGWGDWLFYGHAHPDERIKHFSRWFLIDLSAYRAHLIRKDRRDSIRYGHMPNGDGTHFRWYDIRSFIGEPSLLIAEAGGHQPEMNFEGPDATILNDEP